MSRRGWVPPCALLREQREYARENKVALQQGFAEGAKWAIEFYARWERLERQHDLKNGRICYTKKAYPQGTTVKDQKVEEEPEPSEEEGLAEIDDVG